MKNVVFLFSLLMIAVAACDEELPLISYQVEISNGTTERLTIESYLNDVLQEEVILNSNDTGLSCDYSQEFFLGYWLSGCNIDRVVFKFDNGKGYISDANVNSGYNFSNDEGVFGPSERFILSENGIHQFIITQQDFDNAFDLP